MNFKIWKKISNLNILKKYCKRKTKKTELKTKKGKRKQWNEKKEWKEKRRDPTRSALMGRPTSRAGCAARCKRRPGRSIGFAHTAATKTLYRMTPRKSNGPKAKIELIFEHAQKLSHKNKLKLKNKTWLKLNKNVIPKYIWPQLLGQHETSLEVSKSWVSPHL
jgi:hypothetical protein